MKKLNVQTEQWKLRKSLANTINGAWAATRKTVAYHIVQDESAQGYSLYILNHTHRLMHMS